MTNQQPTPVPVTKPQADTLPDSNAQQAEVDEDRIYAEIANELETGGADKGLWTRLFAECEGDEKQTKVRYIKVRAERLIAAERLLKQLGSIY